MRLSRFCFLGLLIICTGMVYGRQGRDSLLHQLNKAIGQTSFYDAQKQQRIEKIKRLLEQVDASQLEERYPLYLNLYEEYKVFKFDTAFIYATKLEETGAKLNDPSKIAQAKFKRSFVLLSAGLFKEANDVVQAIHVTGLPDSVKAEFYLLKGRYFYDLADFNSDQFYAPDYYQKGSAYMDSALAFFTPSSFEYLYYSGLSKMKEGKEDEAFSNFQTLINRPNLTMQQQALVASTLSYIYKVKGQLDTAIDYQIKASIADIKASTKETFATLDLAQLLFGQGDFKNASNYIVKAIEDASFYGARQRKVQVSTIMPIIQSSQINYIENQRQLWIIYGAVVSGVLILLIFLFVTIYRQNRKLEQAKKDISEAHNKLYETNTRLQVVNEELQAVNTELQLLNTELTEVNAKLSEANKIKEEYIGYFFTINSGVLQKLERLKKNIEQKVADRKLDEIRFIINNINIHNEKEELLKYFDKAFLKLFPHFVEEFNALFEPENRIKLHDNELLNTDLRIYALIRLGIKENEKIAEILEYSIKSIYAYKTKIRNRSKVPKEEFDKLVMNIKSL